VCKCVCAPSVFFPDPMSLRHPVFVKGAYIIVNGGRYTYVCKCVCAPRVFFPDPMSLRHPVFVKGAYIIEVCSTR